MFTKIFIYIVFQGFVTKDTEIHNNMPGKDNLLALEWQCFFN